MNANAKLVETLRTGKAVTVAEVEELLGLDSRAMALFHLRKAAEVVPTGHFVAANPRGGVCSYFQIHQEPA